MKKINKISLLLIIVIISFYVGINRVNAEAICTYVLPYSSYDYTNDKFVSLDLNKDYKFKGVDLVTKNRFNKYLTKSGLLTFKVRVDDEKVSYSSWTKDESADVGNSFSNYSMFSGSCPSFLKLTRDTKIEGNVLFEEGTKQEYNSFLKSKTYSKALYSNSNDNYAFNILADGIKNGDNVVIPLIFDTYSHDEEYKYDAVYEYTSVFAPKWKKTLEHYASRMKNKCGSNWTDYIHNSNKYHDAPLYGHPGDFLDYAFNSNDVTNGVDKDAPAGCMGERRIYLKMWISFYDYWYTLQNAVTNSTKSGINCTSYKDSTFDTNCVYLYGILAKYPEFYNDATEKYNYIVYPGKKRVEDNSDKDAKTLESNNKTLNDLKTVKNDLTNDLCSGYCASNLVADNNYDKYNFDKCKENNASYNTCRSDYNKCKSDSSTCTRCSSLPGDAQSSCNTSCINDVKSCLNDKGHNNIWDKANEKLKEVNTKINELEKENSDILDNRTYKYEDVSLLRFKYGTKPYEPKCSDITFLTSIWSVLIVLAPFLLIVYAAFDYFKCVMAGDEEKMKVAKKKIPKRVIALVLLLVFPQILKMLVSNFGTHRANNTKYIQCILTRDFGEDEDDEDEDKDGGSSSNKKEDSSTKKDSSDKNEVEINNKR